MLCLRLTFLKAQANNEIILSARYTTQVVNLINDPEERSTKPSPS
jgi:hypothetical protein